ncbi:hypothetical protein chiPu_0026050 [Chiloscyllium punctatum]|uniref:Uncharacterized protein n=1 Tax=Chiloscyllium punctatum TaxID=137246 RepID=A0A401TIG8_CHIPU|nr:hypothetical protein [Chiloscyllium punctatum]
MAAAGGGASCFRVRPRGHGGGARPRGHGRRGQVTGSVKGCPRRGERRGPLRHGRVPRWRGSGSQGAGSDPSVDEAEPTRGTTVSREGGTANPPTPRGARVRVLGAMAVLSSVTVEENNGDVVTFLRARR